MRFRIFISSVQSEFASARRQLAAMIRKDRWLQENDLVTNKPFDRSCSFHAESADVDAEKFVDDKGPSQKGLVKGPSQKGSVKGPGQMLLVIRGHSEISISGIADAYGKKSASGSMKRCLLALIEDGLVAPTRPQKRGSRLQTYRITAKGIKFLQQRLKEVDS